MPRKAARGRSRSRRGGGLITWLLIVLLLAIVALFAWPYLQPESRRSTAEDEAESSRPSKDGGENPAAQSRVPDNGRLPEANVRPVPATPAPTPAEDQEANEVAAMVSEGVLTYDRAIRRHREEAAPTTNGSDQR